MKYFPTIVVSFLASVAAAQDHQNELEKYLTDDVGAVAYLDLAQIDTLGALEWVEKLGFGPPPQQRGQATKLMLMVQGQLDKLAGHGARYVYVLFRVSDVSNRGPTWVVPVSSDGNPRAVMGMILSGRPDQFEVERDLRPSFFPEHCEVVEGAVLGANSPQQLKMLKTTRPTKQRDLSDAWKTLGTGHCGLIAFGDPDSRRVVRELFPALPQPFQAIDGPLIAKHLLWCGFVADFPPKPKLTVIVHADQQSTATTLRQTVETGLALLKQLPIDQDLLSDADREALANTITPQVDGSKLIVSFDDLLSDIDRTAHLLKPRVQSAREAAQNELRKTKFRKIALTMHNYHSAMKSFPPRSTFSDDGKPLLSWRVHILPYLGEEELALYKNFHLDEPWDSEHNKQLLPLMPEVYTDPDPALAERNSIGRTTFVVPTGLGTAFDSSEGTLIKEITDGTSNTIMLVEIWSGAGPYWTRPKDWKIDPEIPWERLTRRDERDWITAAYCDGSVSTIPTSTRDDTLRALVTISGGEVVERP